jgi:hypothetical protein
MVFFLSPKYTLLHQSGMARGEIITSLVFGCRRAVLFFLAMVNIVCITKVDVEADTLIFFDWHCLGLFLADTVSRING